MLLIGHFSFTQAKILHGSMHNKAHIYSSRMLLRTHLSKIVFVLCRRQIKT